MKKIYKVVIIFIVFSLLLFNNQVIAKSKYQAQWQESIKANKKILNQKVKQNDIKKHFKLGVAYANLGKIDLAKKEFDILNELENEQKTEQIIEEYKIKSKKDPNNLFYLNYLGFAYYANDDYQLSLDIFKKIVKKDPKNIWSYNYLGTIYGKLENYDEAEKVLKKSMEIESDKYTHFLLGAVYYKSGHIFKALYHMGHSGNVGTKFMD
ncbi:tetratricopeptide repeat protein [Selenihalanaerobacter shriftii]|uniref:Tetratricopeptide repeat-containing protein n=1 Tax=Selenihalanaerobacter shriftii TaxID=142842 RepID=A0A1T4LZQ1_9FIRM|nr:tetratricopeptide repeat protein [Selenihalanaerobacter shriftii]SJZ60142.1 Tetratricopeptide repeat-containing protein [Selenihalanaerobacter shriftii]